MSNDVEEYFLADGDYIEERRTDRGSGDVYIHREGNIGGHFVEVNETITPQRTGKFHARMDRNSRTASVNMDEGGLRAWLASLPIFSRRK